MQERRFDTRKLVNTPVRLYHPELGRLDGIINDISEGGIAIELNAFKNIMIRKNKLPLFLRPLNLDVLFSVDCIRQRESKIAMRFLE